MARDPAHSGVTALGVNIMRQTLVECCWATLIVDETASDDRAMQIIAKVECPSPGGSAIMVRRFEQEPIPGEPMMRGPVGVRNAIKRHAWELEVAEATWMRHHHAHHRVNELIKKRAQHPNHDFQPAPADIPAGFLTAEETGDTRRLPPTYESGNSALAIAALSREWLARRAQNAQQH